jgi:hypothetical protein
MQEVREVGSSLIIFSIDFQTLMALQYFDENVIRSRFDSESYRVIADAQETRIASL